MVHAQFAQAHFLLYVDKSKLKMQMSWTTNQPNVAQGRQARCEEGEGAVLDESKCKHIKRNVERACGQGVCPEWEVGALNNFEQNLTLDLV